jgi:hypothetical protein
MFAQRRRHSRICDATKADAADRPVVAYSVEKLGLNVAD